MANKLQTSIRAYAADNIQIKRFLRVEDAQQLIDQLLFEATEQERQRIVQIQDSGKTRNVNLPKPIPVLLAYWTVEVDMDNRLRFRSDSYARDLKVATALEAAQR